MLFLGVAENISGSIKYARRYLDIPERFDAVFSILTLHHCLDVERFFKSIKNVLIDDGKAVIIDLCKHSFKEFKEETGDVHLGFDTSLLRKTAANFFATIHIERMSGVFCECSGRSVDLFALYVGIK